jgi:hypothetical protein
MLLIRTGHVSASDVASSSSIYAESGMFPVPFGASALGTLFTVSGPAAPIVLPIFATFVLAKWVYDVYNQS